MDTADLQALRQRLIVAQNADPQRQLTVAKETIGPVDDAIVQCLDETFNNCRLRLKNGASPDDAITISDLDTVHHTFVVRGTAVDPIYGLDDAHIVCTFGVSDTSETSLHIEIIPRRGWHFSENFDNLEDTDFDKLQATSPRFIFASHGYYDDGLQVEIQKGVSFYTLISLITQSPDETGAFLKPVLAKLVNTAIPDTLPFYGPLIDERKRRRFEIATDFADVDLSIDVLPSLHLHHTQLVLRNTYSIAPIDNVIDFAVQSDVEVGGVTLPLALHLPLGRSGWELSLIDGRQVPLADLPAFLGAISGVDLLTVLPHELPALRTLAITAFSVAFDLDRKRFTSLAEIPT